MEPELKNVLEACEQLYAPTSSADFPSALLAALKPVLPSAYYSWEMLRSDTITSVSARCEDQSGPVDWSHVAEPYCAFARQHPFAAVALGPPSSQAVARSDLLPDPRWERTDFYNLVLQPLGVKDQLTLAFRGDGVFACLVLHQHQGISDVSRRVLSLLAPHIRQAMNASFRWDEASKAGTAPLGRSGAVQVGFDGHVEHMEPTAERLLRHHFPTEVYSSDVLPGAVRHWFEGAARAMWSAADPVALREGSVVTPIGRLGLTLLTQFAARRHVILVRSEVQLLPSAAAENPGLDRLTPREREVLGWIGEGKRNAEIALILGSQASTVKTQVESILKKLGAETRGVAAAMWREFK